MFDSTVSVNFMILDWRKIKTGILKRFRVGNLPILQIHQGGHRLGWPSVCLFLVNFGGKISNRGGKISNQGGKISNRGGWISNRGGWISNRGGWTPTGVDGFPTGVDGFPTGVEGFPTSGTDH